MSYPGRGSLLREDERGRSHSMPCGTQGGDHDPQRSTRMRKVIVFNIISLDGYHTGPDNDPSVMFPLMGGVFELYPAERLRAADTTLVGRVSFALFRSFWPEVAQDPTSERWTDEQRELSQAGAPVPTIV